MIRRLWHRLFGHPRKSVAWGSFLEGAQCDCGVRFYYWDLVP